MSNTCVSIFIVIYIAYPGFNFTRPNFPFRSNLRPFAMLSVGVIPTLLVIMETIARQVATFLVADLILTMCIGGAFKIFITLQNKNVEILA